MHLAKKKEKKIHLVSALQPSPQPEQPSPVNHEKKMAEKLNAYSLQINPADVNVHSAETVYMKPPRGGAAEGRAAE